MNKTFKKISDMEWEKPRDSAWKAIMRADYGNAVRILAPLYRKYPDDFRVINFYASTLADYGECLPDKEKKLKRRGCELLRGLLRRLRGKNKELGYSTRNEYYYHSAQYDKQYRLGLECVRTGEKRGYYSQGRRKMGGGISLKCGPDARLRPGKTILSSRRIIITPMYIMRWRWGYWDDMGKCPRLLRPVRN